MTDRLTDAQFEALIQYPVGPVVGADRRSDRDRLRADRKAILADLAAEREKRERLEAAVEVARALCRENEHRRAPRDSGIATVVLGGMVDDLAAALASLSDEPTEARP